jgi:hypothetical protein
LRKTINASSLDTSAMTKLFISHSSQDDAFVRALQQALADHGQDVWIDSRELRGGDPLWSEIQKAIEEASAYAVVVSPDALQSKWVGMELFHALEIRKRRGTNKCPVIPLSLNGTKLGVLEQFFGEEPRPRPRRRPGFGIHDGRRNPLPDRDAGKAPVARKAKGFGVCPTRLGEFGC